jgi:hypothetical protein
MTAYGDFLQQKIRGHAESGFIAPDSAINPALFPFQRACVLWALRLGRAAIFADCGLGKTPIQLDWADKVVKETNGRVLIMTPLSVGHQTVEEGKKFGIEVKRSTDGRPQGKITVTNYERLHLFDSKEYVGVVADESSILKNFSGQRRQLITAFMRTMRFRLLCTATASPNDYIELGTSSEALGALGYMDMLARFFKNDNNTCDSKSRVWGAQLKWRFKHHAEIPFWRWVCSWARAFRKPSDMGFDNDGFILPGLIERETVVPYSRPKRGFFPDPAFGLVEQREERRFTVTKRCEAVAEKVSTDKIAVVWCHLNEEGNLLARIIPGAVEVHGGMPDDRKEEIFLAFAKGRVRVLVTKPRIGAFGLNWQHCNHMTFFPSHSYEQYYQGVRRCWRYGQEKPVTVDIVTSAGEAKVLENLRRKSVQADKMFDNLVYFMGDALAIVPQNKQEKKTEVPSWL